MPINEPVYLIVISDWHVTKILQASCRLNSVWLLNRDFSISSCEYFLQWVFSNFRSTAHVLLQVVAMGIQRDRLSFHGIWQVHVPLHWHQEETSIQWSHWSCIILPNYHQDNSGSQKRQVKVDDTVSESNNKKKNIIPSSSGSWCLAEVGIQSNVESYMPYRGSKILRLIIQKPIIDDDSAKWSSTAKIMVMFRSSLGSLQKCFHDKYSKW